MNEGLDTTLVLPDVGEKPSVQYRTSSYTVRQYCVLPYAQRRAVDAACDERAGLTYTTHDDETSEKPYTVGRRATGLGTPYQPANNQPFSLNPAMSLLDAPTAQTMPETEESTSAILHLSESAPTFSYDLAAVVGRYLALTATVDDAHWTHCGPSPFMRGDQHSLAVNNKTGFYQCYATDRSGRALDFVMFMEECSQEEALDWLDANFPIELASAKTVPEADEPSCAYPSFSLEVSATGLDINVEAPKDDFAALAEATVEATSAPAAPATPAAIDGTTYSTTDYDMFHLLPENRVIDSKGVAKLVREIAKKNMLHIRPMDVTPDLGIIDGQHRREAARELGLPIYYRISENLSGADIKNLNVASKNWTGEDYLHHYTVLGNADYQALTVFMQRHRILSFSNAVLLLQDSESMNMPEFRDGLWTASMNTATADETADFIKRIAADVPSFKQSKSSRFIGSVLYCIKSVEGFSSERFLKKILLAPLKLVPCGNRKQYLTLFSEIYNFNAPKEQRINFL